MERPLRVVSYAINGRGVGHLVRQLAILRQIRKMCAHMQQPVECWLITSSEADTLARREGIPAIKLPSKAMLRDAGLEPARSLAILRGFVLNAVASLQPDLLLVDTFPGGSFGELLACLELAPKRVLVARAVRAEVAAEDAYRALLPLYDRVIVPDSGGVGPILIRDQSEVMPRSEARTALGIAPNDRAVYVSLGGGGEVTAPDVLPPLVDALLQHGWHVVVGAGPLYQGPERRGPGITWLDRYVAMELLLGVDAAVSAGGYNSFHELMHLGIPTVFLPLERLADDQHARALEAVRVGAGRLAERWQDVTELLESPGDSAAARALVPENGALAAAVEALSVVLPADAVQAAARALQPKPKKAPVGDPILAGIASGRPLTGPRVVHIDVTNACNAACVTCWDHSPLLDTPRPMAWKRQFLDPQRFFALVEELAALGSVRAVVLSGMGEPFVHPHIYDFIAAVKGRGWHLTIITNLVAADLDRLVPLGVDQLLVGVQGVTPESYTAFHPGWTEAHFFKLCQSLRVLTEAGVRCRHVQVINRDLAWEVVEMVRFGHMFGADRVNYKLASLAEGTEQCIATPLQLAWLATEGIPQARKLAEDLGVPTTLDLFARQVDAALGRPQATTPIEAVGCAMGFVYTRITVAQEVLYCCNTEVAVGSLVGQKFADMWYGGAWQALRDRLRGGDYFDGCHRCGKFEQNVAWGERIRAAGQVWP